MNKNKSIFSFVLYFIFMLGIPFTILLVLTQLNIDDIDKYDFVLTSVVSILMLITYVLIYKDKLIEDFKIFKSRLSHYIAEVFLGWGILFGLSWVVSIIYLILGILEQSENQQIVNAAITEHPFMGFILVLIYAPFVEELVFRLSLRPLIKNRYLFILISSATFGFIHVMFTMDFINIFPYMAMGIGLSYIYQRNDNIIVPILSHFLQNSIAYALMMLTMLLT